MQNWQQFSDSDQLNLRNPADYASTCMTLRFQVWLGATIIFSHEINIFIRGFPGGSV